MLRCTPVLIWCRREGNGWMSRTELFDSNGKVIGSGEAICDRGETFTRKRDNAIIKRWDSDFKVKSMSQTRSTRKAYQMGLGWVMALAGYKTTVADEVLD